MQKFRLRRGGPADPRPGPREDIICCSHIDRPNEDTAQVATSSAISSAVSDGGDHSLHAVFVLIKALAHSSLKPARTLACVIVLFESAPRLKQGQLLLATICP